MRQDMLNVFQKSTEYGIATMLNTLLIQGSMSIIRILESTDMNEAGNTYNNAPQGALRSKA